MNLNAQRPWITPLVIGSFLLSAVTGVLMFFHFDTGLNKTAHEWLGWAMVMGVVLHVLLNFPAFKRYFSQTTARVVMGAFALVLALSFFSVGGEGGGDPGWAGPIRAMADAPVPALAQVAGVSTEDMRARLEKAGLHVVSDEQTVAELAGPDLRAQINALTLALGKAPQ